MASGWPPALSYSAARKACRFCKPIRLCSATCYAESETGALVGNVALGFCLGSLSAPGVVLGLPLDIRHVTFASGNLGHVLRLMCLLGIALIGIANLVTSFGLALWLAMRARGLGYAALLHPFREMAESLGASRCSPKQELVLLYCWGEYSATLSH